MKFLCSKCGACCRKVDIQIGIEHGLPINKDGHCGYLKNNLCSIYETRPPICSSIILGEHFKKVDPEFNVKQYYINTTKHCHKLIDEEGLNDIYKIDIEDYN